MTTKSPRASACLLILTYLLSRCLYVVACSTYIQTHSYVCAHAHTKSEGAADAAFKTSFDERRAAAADAASRSADFFHLQLKPRERESERETLSISTRRESYYRYKHVAVTHDRKFRDGVNFIYSQRALILFHLFFLSHRALPPRSKRTLFLSDSNGSHQQRLPWRPPFYAAVFAYAAAFFFLEQCHEQGATACLFFLNFHRENSV